MRVVFAVNGDPSKPITQAASLASARYRGLIPASEMARRQIRTEVFTVFDLLRPTFDTAGIDLLVLHQPKHDIVAAQNVIGVLLERLDMIRRNGGVIVIDVSDFKFGDSFRAMLRQIIGDAKTAMYHIILNELFARCTAITTPTENLAGQMRGALRQPAPVYVIEDVVEVARGEPRLAPGAALDMLWFGQMTSHIAALQKFVHADLPQIAGTRPVTLTMLCEPVNAEDAARYFGKAPEARGIRFEPWSVPALDQALARCDLVVLPVDIEAAGSKGKSNNRVLQSLYAGRCVVAHPLDSFQKLGDFVRLDRSIPAAVAATLADPAAAVARVRQGQTYLEQHYTPAAITDRWLEICRDLTAKPELAR